MSDITRSRKIVDEWAIPLTDDRAHLEDLYEAVHAAQSEYVIAQRETEYQAEGTWHTEDRDYMTVIVLTVTRNTAPD